jgi:GGDEF domain-containing protein
MIDQAMYSRFGYYGRFLIGEKKTDFNLLGVEKQLKQTSLQLETLQEQFIATLEVSDDGLAFSDIEDKSTWISNTLVSQLGFQSNNINTEDFLKLMQPDDLNRYLTKLNQLTPSSPNMEMKYRLFSNGVYRWYIDKSKKIFLEENTMIMSSINQVSTKHFMRTNLQNLDALGDQNDLTIKLRQLIDEERYFHLVVVRLKNLPYINELHGREVGNMAISEYISKLEKSFTTEPDSIYRLTGSTFAFYLDDQRKMNLMRKGVQGNYDYLNMVLEYGASKLELEVFAGISIINNDGYNENEMLEAANAALKVAENPKYKGHVCYYGDIK